MPHEFQFKERSLNSDDSNVEHNSEFLRVGNSMNELNFVKIRERSNSEEIPIDEVERYNK